MKINKNEAKELLNTVVNAKEANPRIVALANEILEKMNESGYNQEVDLIDRNQYDTVILWNGEKDLKYIIDYGDVFDEEINGMTEGQMQSLIQEASEKIDWDDLEDALISHGNDILTDAIQSALYGNEE